MWVWRKRRVRDPQIGSVVSCLSCRLSDSPAVWLCLVLLRLVETSSSGTHKCNVYPVSLQEQLLLFQTIFFSPLPSVQSCALPAGLFLEAFMPFVPCWEATVCVSFSTYRLNNHFCVLSLKSTSCIMRLLHLRVI